MYDTKPLKKLRKLILINYRLDRVWCDEETGEDFIRVDRLVSCVWSLISTTHDWVWSPRDYRTSFKNQKSPVHERVESRRGDFIVNIIQLDQASDTRGIGSTCCVRITKKLFEKCSKLYHKQVLRQAHQQGSPPHLDHRSSLRSREYVCVYSLITVANHNISICIKRRIFFSYYFDELPIIFKQYVNMLTNNIYFSKINYLFEILIYSILHHVTQHNPTVLKFMNSLW